MKRTKSTKKTKSILSVLMIVIMAASMVLLAPAVSADDETVSVTFAEQFWDTPWTKVESEGLGIFGDIYHEADKFVTPEGLEVIRILLGDFEIEFDRFRLGEGNEPVICNAYAAAVTYIFPFPISQVEVGGENDDTGVGSYYFQGSVVYVSGGPIDYTADFPRDGRKRVSVSEWGGPRVTSQIDLAEGYTYVTFFGPRAPYADEDTVRLANMKVTVEAQSSGLTPPPPTEAPTLPPPTLPPPTEAPTEAQETEAAAAGETDTTVAATTASNSTNNTDDNDNLWLYIIIVAAAVIVIVIIVIFITKKKPAKPE